MATAGTATVTTAGTEVYNTDANQGCTVFLVHVLSTSSNGALVNIPGLHASGEFFPIPVGGEYAFRQGHQNIDSVTVKGDGGNADINYGVIADGRR